MTFLQGDKYELASKVKPRSYKAHRNWGVALAKLARMKKGKEVEQLFQLASQKFQVNAHLEELVMMMMI